MITEIGAQMFTMNDESSAGPSVWERELHAHLTNHVESEKELLKEYSVLAETTDSEAFRYLVRLLVEDEMRHHQVFAELANALEAQALLADKQPAVPYMDFRGKNRDAVHKATEALMAKENQDASDLKRLQRELRDVKDTTLWGLLVEIMQRDTQKHLAILQFVADHA